MESIKQEQSLDESRFFRAVNRVVEVLGPRVLSERSDHTNTSPPKQQKAPEQLAQAS